MVDVATRANALAGVLDDGNFPDEIRGDRPQLPQGCIKWKLGQPVEEVREFANGAKCIIEVELTALAPMEAAGQTYRKLFFVGTKNDPEAKNKETWTFPTVQNFNTMAQKAGVGIQGKNRGLIYSELRGREVVGKVTYSARPGDTKLRANIDEWYGVGDVELSVSPAPSQPSQPMGAIPGPQGLARPLAGGPPAPPSGFKLPKIG